ncbi:uncharacterized protein LOC117913846 isoform X1 [Vitis riparia]|uniref:uncharacterized protein LOC117913846 isoform X1 n=1 Tax=Vitis riparia TaxID=96939 RepID=UPI00155AA598|nr:uncharacterized protein LOC117913846 isoform X1 [Vitis riparia]
METAKLEGVLQVLSTSLSRTKWRLKASSKRRLEIDILALCTGMRPVVMVDYGGKMPELQERLCAVLKLSQKASSIFYHLRIMVIEDMIYLIHVKELAEHVRSSLNSEPELHFVDLEHNPPKMIVQAEKSSVTMQLISVQKWFSLLFPVDEINNDLLPSITTEVMSIAKPSISEPIASQSSDIIDLSSAIQGTQVAVPTLNGWLLGYPVVYLFSTEHISDAIFNLSTKSLRIFKILICRNDAYKGSGKEELLSFSVPYDLSMGGSNEPWAKAFMAHLETKWEKCKQVWSSLQMEVSEYPPQAIAL